MPALGPDFYVDEITYRMGLLARSLEDQQRVSIKAQQRGDELSAAAAKKAETAIKTALTKTMQEHPMWSWLSQFPGLATGSQMAQLMSYVRDPRRFPGQRCTEGHNLAAIYDVGGACPLVIAVKDAESLEPCAGTMLEPRPHSGVKSLWHYFGCHAVDGKTPRKARGQQADWHLRGRSIIFRPSTGLSGQIVLRSVEPYVTTYRQTKERLLTERGEVKGLDFIARKVAVKQFLGDFLIAWKQV